MNKKSLGSLYIFLSAVLFSMGGLCIKMISWSPLAINGARSLISVIIIGLYLKRKKVRLKVNRFVLLGALCMCATNTLYVLANKLTTAANTIVLQFTAPIFIIFFMFLFFREKPDRVDVITCIVVLSGILFFFLDGLQTGNMTGNMLALLSGVTYAGVFMLNKFPNAHPISSIIIGQMTGIVIGFPSMVQQTDFSFTTLSFILVLGVFQLGLAYIFFSKGLENTPPVTASLISGIEPILNPTLTAIFYHETMSTMALAGGLIVFISIILYNVYKSSLKTKSKATLKE